MTLRSDENVEGGAHFCPLRTANFTSISQDDLAAGYSGILKLAVDGRMLGFSSAIVNSAKYAEVVHAMLRKMRSGSFQLSVSAAVTLLDMLPA